MGKQRIIIFDSPDGTGKTNIAQALAKEIGIPYFKMNTEHQNWRSRQFKTALEFDQTYLYQFLKQTGHSVIIDRAYPAEWVYSRVYNRPTNEQLLVQLDQGFADLGTVVIIPLRHDYTKNRPDDLVKPEMLPKLHDGYLHFSKWTSCDVIKMFVDDLNDDLENELDYIAINLKKNFGWVL